MWKRRKFDMHLVRFFPTSVGIWQDMLQSAWFYWPSDRSDKWWFEDSTDKISWTGRGRRALLLTVISKKTRILREYIADERLWQNGSAKMRRAIHVSGRWSENYSNFFVWDDYSFVIWLEIQFHTESVTRIPRVCQLEIEIYKILIRTSCL